MTKEKAEEIVKLFDMLTVERARIQDGYGAALESHYANELKTQLVALLESVHAG